MAGKALTPFSPAETKLARKASEVWLAVRDDFRNWLIQAG
jgi:hypothetical protein